MAEASHHAKVYQVAVTQISRWRTQGIKAGMLPPLDSPELMPEWWGKMRENGFFGKGVPTRMLVAAAAAGLKIEKPERFTDAKSTPGDHPTEPGKPRDYAATLALAERNVDAVEQLFNKAVLEGKDALLISLQRTLNDAVDSHRALMRHRGKIQSEAGETLPKAEVRQALLEIHGNVTKRFRQGLKSAFADVPDHAETMETWGVWVDSLVDSICQGMRETEFAAPIEP